MPQEQSRQELAWGKYQDGLMPVIVQESATGEILMQAYANQQALDETRRTGDATFWSRSRNELWRKGATSGDVLKIDRIRTDCDVDAIIYEVRMQGAQACHVPGEKSCFHQDIDLTNGEITPLQRPVASWSRVFTDEEIMLQAKQAAGPEASYTAKALHAPSERVGQKVGEEGVEVAISVAREEGPDKIIDEAADLLYRLQIAFVNRGISWKDLEKRILERRKGWEIQQGQYVETAEKK